MRKLSKIWLFVLIAAVAVAGVALLAKVYLSATSPSSVKLTVHKVEFMADASDTNPQVVFSNATGKEIDLTKDTDAVIEQAQIQAGTYKRIRMTVTNGIKLSIANAVDNPCGRKSGTFTDSVFSIADGTDLNWQVQINFATYDDRGGTWAGSRITHILLGPVAIRENQTEPLKFNFITANTLFCSGGAVKMRSPWAVWVNPL
ncbi:MAG: DUF4382 domain-containing protein [Nitrospirae bacterium]|nr:DUF4382 domain-containing protein [Nitrospirota bacterium]